MMDNNNWRPAQGEPNMAGVGAGDGQDWRTQLQADSRQRIVNKIMETLKRHLPILGPEGLQELKKIAVRFEEKIYSAATTQSDYLRKISLKMLTMETKSQNSVVANSLPQNPVISNQNPGDPDNRQNSLAGIEPYVPMPLLQEQARNIQGGDNTQFYLKTNGERNRRQYRNLGIVLREPLGEQEQARNIQGGDNTHLYLKTNGERNRRQYRNLGIVLREPPGEQEQSMRDRSRGKRPLEQSDHDDARKKNKLVVTEAESGDSSSEILNTTSPPEGIPQAELQIQRQENALESEL